MRAVRTAAVRTAVPLAVVIAASVAGAGLASAAPDRDTWHDDVKCSIDGGEIIKGPFATFCTYPDGSGWVCETPGDCYDFRSTPSRSVLLAPVGKGASR